MSGGRLVAGGPEGMLSRQAIAISYYQGLVKMLTAMPLRVKEKSRQDIYTYNQGG